MRVSHRAFVKGTSWTIIAYTLGQVLRFFTNFVLTRILAPELFGVMVIVNSLGRV